MPARSIDWERLLTFSYRHYVPLGSIILDVGAHHGMHSRRLLRYLRPRRLILVEPIPEMAQGLQREFRRRPQVEVRQVALGLTRRTSTFVINDSAPGESGLQQRHDHDEAEFATRIEVSVERLDDWELDGSVGFMKVDVEGGEIDVLEGGRRLLAADRPIVTVEYGRAAFSAYGHSSRTLFELASELNYALLDLLGNVIGEDWDEIVDEYYWDYVLVPRERLPLIEDARAAVRRQAMRYLKHPRPRVERWKKRLRR